MLNADKGMFRVILNNLLENALKYTVEGTILVEAYETRGEIVISISDTGIGVPKDEIDKIFERFYRSKDEKVQNKDGIGIGLYLSRKYVELHGGNLTYEPVIEEKESKPGKILKIEKGSKFIIKIPMEEKEKMVR
jgi:signal transduction histidine kinase